MPKKSEMEPEKYLKHKEEMARRNRLLSLVGRDIGEIPKVLYPKTRSDCEFNLQLYCEMYHPEAFPIEWSEDHLKAIAMLKEAVLKGALFALAMPRGSGKTTLVIIATIWAIAYGHRQFVFIVGADESAAESMLAIIKSEIQHNEYLFADFPEICYPIKQLGGEARRVAGQLHNGESTQIIWKAKEIVFPKIPNSKSSGSVIRIAGITGKIRGANKILTTGEVLRPDLAIVDDPQTDESANSVTQCAARLSTVTGSVLGLAGLKKKIAGFMPCTVIVEGDMADTVLNQDLYPDWNGLRTMMVKSFPKNTEMWEEYNKIRVDSLKRLRNISEATEFYRKNRDTMDLGAQVSWIHRFDQETELSAIQHAMNLMFRDESSFFSEYQNAPKSKNKNDTPLMSTIEISSKINSFPRREIPHECTKITGGIDVQKDILFFTIIAWSETGSGYVIDYGAYPDPKKKYFTKKDIKSSYLDNKSVTGGLGAKLTKALEILVPQFMEKQYMTNSGTPLQIDMMLIDANWHASTKTIYEYVRRSKYGPRLRPSHGRFYGAATAPLSERKRKDGERMGNNWVITYPKSAETIRYVFFDTNYWKMWLHDRFMVGTGGDGCISLWGTDKERHRMYGDHLTSEPVILVEARGRKVSEFKPPVSRDNDLLDTSVLCCVGASIQGVTVRGIDYRPEKTQKKPKRKMSDILADKRREF